MIHIRVDVGDSLNRLLTVQNGLQQSRWLYTASDLVWWFGFQPSELDEMSLDIVENWLKQAHRQIKAKYSKATF